MAEENSILLPKGVARHPILLPAELSLRNNYDATVSAVNELRHYVFERNERVFLIFNNVKMLEPTATLLLAAEIYRCRNLRRSRRAGPMVQGNYPADNDVFLQLREMGFFRLLGVSDRDEVPDWVDRKGRPHFVSFHTLRTVDAEYVAGFCDMVAGAAIEMSDVAKRRMTAAIKEAMGNAEEHAYRVPTNFPVMSSRWWLTSYIDPDKREMQIVLLDQGAGIPQTLEPTLYEQVKSLITSIRWTPSDGHLIAAATELYRTSTAQSGRGKGFRDMKSFIQACDDGELRVLSNRGRYTYMKSGEQIADEERSIGGTIVEWRIRHAETVEVDDG